MRAIVTGQVGVDKGPYLEAVKQAAIKAGHDLEVCHVGKMMYQEAPDVPAGRILNLPITRLNTLRRAVFKEILHDETFHMNYTLAQLNRVASKERGSYLWRARMGRLWKAYLRIMAAIAGVIGAVFLTLQYFILIPPFAWMAKRAERREPEGWKAAAEERPLKSQY